MDRSEEHRVAHMASQSATKAFHAAVRCLAKAENSRLPFMRRRHFRQAADQLSVMEQMSEVAARIQDRAGFGDPDLHRRNAERGRVWGAYARGETARPE